MGKIETDMSDEWRRMISSMEDMYSDGEEIYEMLVKSRPKDTEIIVCPGHMGDTLLISSLAEEYKKQHGVGKLIYVSQSLPEEMIKCYSAVDAVLMLEKDEMKSLDFYMTVRRLWNQNGIRYAHFQNNVVLNFPKVSYVNLLDYSQFSLRENRMLMMELNKRSYFSPLKLAPLRDMEQLKNVYGNAILLMPVSYSAKSLPESFWEALAASLKKKGYDVYTNYNQAKKESVINGTKAFGSSFYEFAQMTQVFSLFIGVRSGLCDLISLTGNGELVILYNETVFENEGDIEIAEEEMKESNIYDLGRREGIHCYRYLSGEEERIIDAICEHLPA